MSDKAARTPAEIQADIEATRASLVGNVDTLATAVQPRTIAANAQARAVGWFQLPDGRWDTKKVVIVGGVAALVTVGFVRTLFR